VFVLKRETLIFTHFENRLKVLIPRRYCDWYNFRGNLTRSFPANVEQIQS